MRTKSIFMLIVMLLIFLPLSLYPIPVVCKNYAHSPVNALVSQSFMHLGHVGVDYNVSVGTEVRAVMDGIVIRIEDKGLVYGRYLMLLHCDGYLSLYAHLSGFTKKFGDIVESGNLIAYSGGDPKDEIDGDGWSSGAHLHFEVRIPGYFDNNLYNIDPVNYIEMRDTPDIPTYERDKKYG